MKNWQYLLFNSYFAALFGMLTHFTIAKISCLIISIICFVLFLIEIFKEE